MRLLALPPAARYALQGLISLARQPNGYCMAASVADSRRFPVHYLSKIFQRLARRRLLAARRGPGGGYRLARPAGSISLAEIVEAATEQPRGHRPCLLDPKGCDSRRPCRLHGAITGVEGSLTQVLRRTSLADIAATA